MKKNSFLIIIFLLLIHINQISPFRKRMAEIYQKINTTLKQRRKKKYLSYPHVFKVKISLYKKEPLNCFIRLKSEKIRCIPFKSNKGSIAVTKNIKNISKVKIIKWKPYKYKTIKQFVKYLYKPSVILLIFKNGKKYYVADSHKSAFYQNYVFMPGDENKTVFSNFILYYNKKTNKFYGTNKSISFHVKTPAKNTATTYKILEYKYQKISKNRLNNIPSFSPDAKFKMKKGSANRYFSSVKKRWRQQQRERQKARATERERLRKLREKYKKKNKK